MKIKITSRFLVLTTVLVFLSACGAIPTNTFYVSRLDSSGSLDPLFNGGDVFTNRTDRNSPLNVATDAQKQIILGNANDKTILILKQSGRKYTEFDGATPGSDEDDGPAAISDIEVEKRAGVLATGFIASSGSKLFRYGSLGPDTSFGTDGVLELSYQREPTDAEISFAIKVVKYDDNNNVLVGGDNRRYQSALVTRISPAGVVDPTFGTNGFIEITRADFPDHDWAGEYPIFWTYDLLTDRLGRNYAVVADIGIVSALKDQPVFITRFSSAGVLDTSFGSNGIVTLQRGEYPANVIRLAMDSHERLVVAFSRNTFEDFGVEIHRILDSGNLDPSFGLNGFTFIKSRSFDGPGRYGPSRLELSDMAIDENDIVICATTTVSRQKNAGNYSYIARLQKNGRLDPSFAGSGFIEGEKGTYCDSMALSDGKITIAGRMPTR